MGIKCPKCNTNNPDTQKFCGECATPLPSSKEILDTETLETPTEELTTGSTFAGRYQIIEELGKGGMGKVYKALDTEIKEKIALKLINPEISADKKTIERFQNELKFARKISHRNVCRMYDLNKEEGNYYITMEYVPGEDLKSVIGMMGQLSGGKAISVARQVCEGLTEAHKLGVVHRDLKPQNIMIDKEGNARIMDFGIARSIKGKGITDAGVMIGTPEYMSPEQAEVKEVDQRSDIYSLGVILYEMATGRVPFEGETPFGIAMKHKSEMPKDPRAINAQIPEDLSKVILRCMEKDKEKRYQSAGEVRAELERIEKSISTTERIIPKRKLKTGFPRKRFQTLVVPGAILFAAILIVGGFFFYHRIFKKEEPKKTRAISKIKWKNSIAVLPFVDLSPQKDQGYFCDGMTEDIILKLSGIRNLKVSSRTSVIRYKNTDKNIKEIGQELGVATVLEGSVQKEKDNIRVIAQLINVEDNFHLWSQSYNRKLESFFAIQDDISKAIAEALKIHLTKADNMLLRKIPTESIEGYEYYLKGRSLFYTYEKSKNEQAIAMFEKAIECDSSFSLAYAGLSLCYTQYINSGWDNDEKWLLLAEDAAKKAIELDNNSAEAHFALGFIYEKRRAYEELEREMRRVIELNPNHAHARDSMGDLLHRAKGDLENAHNEFRLALMIDPFLLPSYWGIYEVRAKQGKYLDAEKILLRSLEHHENHDITMMFLSRIYRFSEEYKRSVEVLKKAVMFNPSRIEIHLELGLAYAQLNNINDAYSEANIIANIAAIPEEENFSYFYLLGWISLAQGNWQTALENFEQALRIRRNISPSKAPVRSVYTEDILKAIAETYLRQENFKAAIKEYTKMDDFPIGMYQFDKYMWAIRHYKLGYAYEKMNDLTEAKKEYQKFLDLWKDADPGIAEVEDAKKRLAGLKNQ